MRFNLALALTFAASPVAAQTLPPLLVATVLVATVLADAVGAPAFAVPFASTGNRIELAVRLWARAFPASTCGGRCGSLHWRGAMV